MRALPRALYQVVRLDRNQVCRALRLYNAAHRFGAGLWGSAAFLYGRFMNRPYMGLYISGITAMRGSTRGRA